MGLLAKLTGKRSLRANAAKKNGSQKSKYRGVQIDANNAECCSAAKEVAGKRFLSDEVPVLPLEDCDAVECRCTYELYDDRRTDVRRASDLAYDLASEFHTESSRSAHSSGRRGDD